MDKILALMTPFMKKELTTVLHMHSDLKEFYKFVPQEMLPKEYGGQLEEANVAKGRSEGVHLNMRKLLKQLFAEIYYKKLLDNRKEMIEFETRHQVNEKLRPGKAKNASDLFGIEGNFKKLDID